MWEKIKNSKWFSRKLVAAIIGVVLTLVGHDNDPQTVEMIITLIMTYIGGQAVVDSVKEYKKPTDNKT